MVWIALWCLPVAAQSFFNSHNNLNPNSNPRGLNKELDNATLETGWELLRWDSANLGYSINDTLPFSWIVNGNSYAVFKAVTNGSITFSSNPLPTVTHLFQTSSLPDPRLAERSLGFFGLMARRSNDQVYTKTFGQAPNRQYWIKFSSFSLPSDSITGYSVYGNYALVLEENSNAVHFVQMTQGNLTGIPFNNQKRAALTMGANWGTFDGTNVADDNLDNILINYVPAPLHNGVSDNRYFTLLPSSKLSQWNDAILLSADLEPSSGYVKEGADFSIAFSFAARGLAKPQSLSLNIQIGNKPLQTFALDTFTTPNNVGVYSGNIQLSAANLTAGVQYPISAWLVNTNAVESDKSNDSLNSFANIIVQSQQIQVTGYPCLEVFTGNWDHQSALLDVTLDNLKKNNPVLQNSIVLKHHVLDPMTTDMSGILNPLSGGIDQGVFPAITLNRGLMEPLPEKNVFGSDSLLAKLSKYQVNNTFLVPRVENLKYDPSTKTISGTYRVSALDYFDPSTVKVTLFLREKTQRGNTSGWLQKMSLEETKRTGSVFFGKSTKMVGYTYTDVAFDWNTEGNDISGKPLGNAGITSPGIDFNGTVKFVLPDSMVKVTFPKTVDFADSGDAFLRYKPADLEVVLVVTDDRLKSKYKRLESNVMAPMVTATIQPLWDVLAKNQHFESAARLVAYPNPSNEYLKVESGNRIQSAEVLDMSGKVQNLTFNRRTYNEIEFNTTPLVPGLYLVRVVDSRNQAQTIRFVKSM